MCRTTTGTSDRIQQTLEKNAKQRTSFRKNYTSFQIQSEMFVKAFAAKINQRCHSPIKSLVFLSLSSFWTKSSLCWFCDIEMKG